MSTQTSSLNTVEHLKSGQRCQQRPLPFYDHIKNTGGMKTDILKST